LLVPEQGWQILFAIGDVVPILVAIVCLFGLPESIKYLTITVGRRCQGWAGGLQFWNYPGVLSLTRELQEGDSYTAWLLGARWCKGLAALTASLRPGNAPYGA
jgi:hypothetical protein